MGNFALAAMPGKLPLWTLFWNEKSFYFLITLVLTKLKYNSGIRQCFFLEYHPYGEAHRIVTEYQFCPEYLFQLIFFSKQ